MRGYGIIISLLFAPLAQQPKIAQQTFEAASVKPSSDSFAVASGISESKGRMIANNVTLKRCIRGAYDVAEAQVVGGPKWIDQDRFNIEAKASGAAGDRELMVMLRSLLADRFQLKLHVEQRITAGYKLVLGKRGLKIKPSDTERGCSGHSSRGRIEISGCALTQLAVKLSEVLQRPVTDSTGTKGNFDLKLEWTPDDMQAQASQHGRASTVDSGPSIFSALQEQLGLRLQSAKLPREVLVVDYAVQPKEN